MRVKTRRGWVVLASDSSHYYEHFQKGRFLPGLQPRRHAAGLRTLHRLADSPNHIIPGHDPLVMKRYPAVSPALEGIAVRLDVEPRT